MNLVETGVGELFNPLEPFSFFLTIEEWIRIRPKDSTHFSSDGRRALQPGWTDLFEFKLREVNPACIRWYTGSVKKVSSRKQTAPYFTGRAACRNPECSLTYRMVIEQEPTASTKEVEVIVAPQGSFAPSDPIEVQNRHLNRMKKREYMKMLEDEAEETDSPSETLLESSLTDYNMNSLDYTNSVTKRYPPFVRYGKRNVGGSSNVLVGCGSGKTMEDLLYCSTLEADKAKLLAEKEKFDAETIMLRAKTEELIAKKAKLETETNNLIMQRLKLKHELNAIGLDVEIVTVDESQMRAGLDVDDR